jgi:hypothetical protein
MMAHGGLLDFQQCAELENPESVVLQESEDLESVLITASLEQSSRSGDLIFDTMK